MQATHLTIPEVILFTPKLIGDDRGFFYESFSQNNFVELTGLTHNFVQDNHSKSQKGVLRGLHYQLQPKAQGKLVRVIQGNAFNVAVNLRKNTPTFGQWVGAILSAENKQQMWIPEGFAHGFLTLSETAEISFKTTNYYAPDYERSILWNDKEIGINWPIEKALILSDRDKQGKNLSDAECFYG
ncbi:dTDP-4-dehydrorhamnose 3,5-epimerase [Methylomonas sp. AM2-LC]|uniref:dTDP-4-dehydrorhamnose 3,5-epimerase n=1 Tax=Methylomonas sp. AM2-LC TaxID=3153301 RepID=UPI0032666885